MINGENFFNKPVQNHKVTYDYIKNICTGSGNDYSTGSLLDYPYFKDNYRRIAVDLRKQQILDSDLRAVEQINFTANLDRAGNTRIYFILEKLDFSQ